jgi:DivIVA domain-containing protein
MQWALAILAVAVLGVAAVAASGRLGGLPPVVDDTPAPYLPGGRLTPANLQEVRFTVETRGYSMRQVDELMDRLSAQLAGAGDEPGIDTAEGGGSGPEPGEAQTIATDAHSVTVSGDNGPNAQIDRSS